ncbi:MAG: ABC transporter ATP-binding protein [Bifidobacterium adolescentis]
MDLLKTHNNKIVTLGMAHIPEGRHVFTRMSVEENLEMGAFSLKDQSGPQEGPRHGLRPVPRLKERRNQKAGTLSGGEQQMLAMGRALMSHPKTITHGRAVHGPVPEARQGVFYIIRKLHEQGITILLVEQNAKIGAVDRRPLPYVLETGRITMEGDAKELLNNEQVHQGVSGRLIRAVSALSAWTHQTDRAFFYIRWNIRRSCSHHSGAPSSHALQ